MDWIVIGFLSDRNAAVFVFVPAFWDAVCFFAGETVFLLVLLDVLSDFLAAMFVLLCDIREKPF
jgi:hypothetical protein